MIKIYGLTDSCIRDGTCRNWRLWNINDENSTLRIISDSCDYLMLDVIQRFLSQMEINYIEIVDISDTAFIKLMLSEGYEIRD